MMNTFNSDALITALDTGKHPSDGRMPMALKEVEKVCQELRTRLRHYDKLMETFREYPPSREKQVVI
jgi:hypothetical protein